MRLFVGSFFSLPEFNSNDAFNPFDYEVNAQK